jgi:hypothetical protein
MGPNDQHSRSIFLLLLGHASPRRRRDITTARPLRNRRWATTKRLPTSALPQAIQVHEHLRQATQAFSSRFGLTILPPAIPSGRLRNHAGGGNFVCVLTAALRHTALCPSGWGDGLGTRVCPWAFESAQSPCPACVHIAVGRHTRQPPPVRVKRHALGSFSFM